MSKRQYSGEPLDVSWQTPPWQNNGETLDAYDSEGDGEIMTIDWPENATDPDELNDKQKKMILTAVNYPDIDSPTQLVELSGLDVSPAYPQNVLEVHWPERFWGANNSEQSNDIDIDVTELRQRLLDGQSLNQLVKEYPASQEYLSRLVRGEVDNMPNSDLPPLEWLGNSEQRWINPHEYYDEPIEANYDNANQATITEPISKLRERVLAGETAQDLAEDHGVAGRTIRKRLKGEYENTENPSVPPLKYDAGAGRWRIDNSGEDEDNPCDEIEPQTVRYEPSVKRQHSVPAWVWAVFGAFAMWVMSKLRE